MQKPFFFGYRQRLVTILITAVKRLVSLQPRGKGGCPGTNKCKYLSEPIVQWSESLSIHGGPKTDAQFIFGITSVIQHRF